MVKPTTKVLKRVLLKPRYTIEGRDAEMEFTESQTDMRESYYSGATGVFASGMIWLLAGIVGTYFSNTESMITLFIGGMFIFPLALLGAKLLGRSGKHATNNSLRHLALEGLATLFVGLFLAYCIAQYKIELFYPFMLMIIGARYLTFQTLYGLRIYWLLGAALIVAGFISVILNFPFIFGAYIGGFIEILFALIIFRQCKIDLSAHA
jgi:hypothetical protein